jgi:hypothetical protein
MDECLYVKNISVDLYYWYRIWTGRRITAILIGGNEHLPLRGSADFSYSNCWQPIEEVDEVLLLATTCKCDS